MNGFVVCLDDDSGDSILTTKPLIVTNSSSEDPQHSLLHSNGWILIDLTPQLKIIDSTCVSTQWQNTEPVSSVEWEFEDITQSDHISELHLRGTRQSLPIIDAPPTELIANFKSRTDTLLNILTT